LCALPAAHLNRQAITSSTSPVNTPHSLCLLFADVAGSTRLYETIGDQQALAAVERCLSILRRVTETYRGRVIKTIGDEIMAVFSTAEDGMQAASEMQQRIFDLPPFGKNKIAIRVGFHYGPVVEVDGDVFGDTVNTAARMAGLAKAGQIFTTQSSVALLPELLRLSTRSLDALSVKGKAEDVLVAEVIWQENSELTMKATSVKPRLLEIELELRGGDQVVVMHGNSEALTMGRDPSCGLVIRDARASRVHARIERQRDKFILFDQSTNGTFLKIGDEEIVVLRHESMPLHGTGCIGFGHSAEEAGEDALEYTLSVKQTA
jgi:class 3 adenylate cyclase